MTESELTLRNFIDWFAPNSGTQTGLHKCLDSVKINLANCLNCKYFSGNYECPCNNKEITEEVRQERKMLFCCVKWQAKDQIELHL